MIMSNWSDPYRIVKMLFLSTSEEQILEIITFNIPSKAILETFNSPIVLIISLMVWVVQWCHHAIPRTEWKSHPNKWCRVLLRIASADLFLCCSLYAMEWCWSVYLQHHWSYAGQHSNSRFRQHWTGSLANGRCRIISSKRWNIALVYNCMHQILSILVNQSHWFGKFV